MTMGNKILIVWELWKIFFVISLNETMDFFNFFEPHEQSAPEKYCDYFAIRKFRKPPCLMWERHNRIIHQNKKSCDILHNEVLHNESVRSNTFIIAEPLSLNKNGTFEIHVGVKKILQ